MGTELGQKNFLGTCVENVQIKRRYGVKNVQSRRNCLKQYFLPLQGNKIQICQQFHLATLSITQKKIRYLADKKTTMNTPQPERRGHMEPKNKTPIGDRKTIDNWQDFRNMTNLYILYKQDCIDREKGA